MQLGHMEVLFVLGRLLIAHRVGNSLTMIVVRQASRYQDEGYTLTSLLGYMHKHGKMRIVSDPERGKGVSLTLL